jgi:hypothetical protein
MPPSDDERLAETRHKGWLPMYMNINRIVQSLYQAEDPESHIEKRIAQHQKSMRAKHLCFLFADLLATLYRAMTWCGPLDPGAMAAEMYARGWQFRTRSGSMSSIMRTSKKHARSFNWQRTGVRKSGPSYGPRSIDWGRTSIVQCLSFSPFFRCGSIIRRRGRIKTSYPRSVVREATWMPTRRRKMKTSKDLRLHRHVSTNDL